MIGRGSASLRLSAGVLILLLARAAQGAAQGAPPVWSGYYLNVAGVSGSNALTQGGLSDFQRLRLMAAPALGPVRLEAAYEQLFLCQQRPGGAFAALAPGTAPTSGDWLRLDWTLADRTHVLWRHRFDRLDLALPADRFEARVGRQAISWATTLIFTPADPFAPFDPSDPFREYRNGVDAARVQYFPGPLSGVDIVVRPERFAGARLLTAAARGKVTIGRWDLSAWAGQLHGVAAAAAGATGSVAGAAVRGEIEVRRTGGGGAGEAAVVRAAVGVDRRWSVLGRDLYVIVEYQHDGLAAASPAQLTSVLLSPAYARGELQVLGRDVAAGQLSWQVHPLVAAELLTLWDLRDASALLAPALSYSASDAVSLRAGLFLGAGRGAGATGLGSEFGGVPAFGYASVSAFF